MLPASTKSLAQSLAGSLAATLLAIPAIPAYGMAWGPGSWAGLLDPAAACAAPQVIGICTCGGVPCGIRVRRYVPVAIVETVRSPGDSLVAAIPFLPSTLPGALAAATGLDTTGSSSLSTTDNTAEVHVWTLASLPIPGLSCLACGPSSALVPAAPPASAGSAGPRCGGALTATEQALATAAGALATLGMPRLVYASELDVMNWRTGCRDGASTIAALATGSMPTIGAWGALLPRQMRDIGPPPRLYSALTGVRAMSLARDQLGTFPFPVDTQGKLQQAYPVVSACFPVGGLPLPTAPASAMPTVASPDGRIAWVYWRPVVCCIGASSEAQCLKP